MQSDSEAKVFPSLARTGGARHASIPVHVVLHVDDDPNDAELLRAATRQASAKIMIQTVEDGDGAMAYLAGVGKYSDRDLHPLPNLVLLDLKMPRATGFEILRWIRSKPAIAHIPVVILSGSELRDDMEHAYKAGANSYMVKPLGFESLVGLVKDIGFAWFCDI
jgi:CheY-like chemotaxis protein